MFGQHSNTNKMWFLGTQTLKPDYLGSVPNSATYWVCKLGKLINFSKPQFLYLQKKNGDNTKHITLWLELNEIVLIRGLSVQHMVSAQKI